MLGTFALLLAAMTWHALPFTRQPDVQSIQYAFELLSHLKDGTLSEYLLAPKKYPLPYVGIHAVLYVLVILVLLATGTIESLSQPALEQYLFTDPSAIHLVTRLFTAASAVLLVFLAMRCARKLFPGTEPLTAGALIVASPLILSLTTAMRPHIPHLALLLLTFLLSMRLAERQSMSRALAAFGSAALAFGFLQNGFLAFIFPFAALGWDNGRFRVRSLFRWRYVLVGIGMGLLTVTVSYPFLWKELFFDGKLGIGLGNEDIAETPWNINGYIIFVRTLFGSELVLLGFAVASLWLWLCGKLMLHPFFAVAGVYCVIYVLIFGMVGWAPPRYFLPVSVFLALLGAPALHKSPLILKACVLLFIAAMHVQLMRLALKPDTYDVAAAYLRQETQGVIASGVAHYHLGIPPNRESLASPSMARERWIAAQPVNLRGARSFVSLADRDLADVVVVQDTVGRQPLGDAWRLCQEIHAAGIPATMFLWSEVDMALPWLWRTERLGPTIFIYCRV